MTQTSTPSTSHFSWRRPAALVAVLMSLISLVHAADFHVAPQGSDQNPGTKEKPFASLEAARDAIRELRTGEADKTVRHTVLLHGGVYPRTKTFELDQRDSFTTYKPAQADGGAVRLLGGVEIPLSAMKPVTDPAVLNRVIEKAARPHLRQIDLKALGITEYGEFGPRGFRRAYIPAPLELFIDGSPMQVARWPNVGEPNIQIGKVIDGGSRPRYRDYSSRGAIFEYDEERPNQWTAADDFYISGIFQAAFADDTIKVAKLDTEKGTFTTAHPHMYGFSRRSYTSWYALNLLEEIDLPGEYYVDKTTGIVYFYPPESASAQSTVHVSTLDKVMVAIENAEAIRIERLTLELSRDSGIYIEGGKGHEIVGCTLRNLGILAIQLGQGIEPFPYGKHNSEGSKADGKPGVPVSRMMGSWHEWIYKDTAWDRNSGTNHKIISCDIYDTGAGGVMLGGGDRKTLTPGNNAVINCDIYRVNRWDRSYKTAVNIDGVGNKVQHCHIHQLPGSAIYLHGNDHLVEYNEMNNVLLGGGEMGAFYMGRDPSEYGNILRYNFIYNTGNQHLKVAGIFALHLDDIACGLQVIGNVIYNTDHETGVNGGYHSFINNIFVDNENSNPKHAGIRAGRSPQVFHKWCRSGLGKARLRVNVDVTKPPYSTKYPDLYKLYNDPPDARRSSKVWYNVFVRSGSVKSPRVHENPEGHDARNNLETDQDPGFVDPGNLNFQLKDDSIVYQKIPEFKRIPFEQIGLKTDEYRTVLPPSAPPIVTPSAGLFHDAITINFELGAGDQAREDLVVRYTTDGSDPTPASPEAKGPLVLRETTQVKAQTFARAGGAKPSPVVVTDYKETDTLYLSMFPETDSKAHKGLKKDSNYAETGNASLGGKSYYSSLMVCPVKRTRSAHVTYTLDGPLEGGSRFRAEVGIDDAAGSSGSVLFIVHLQRQGRWIEAFRSPVVRGGEDSVSVDLDITGAEGLRLVTTDGGDNANSDHAVWADARVE